MKPSNTKYKRVVDNHMRWHGDIDEDKKIIRVNKSKKKNKHRGEILDTIVHEETHRKHQKMHEKTVYKKTRKIISRLSKKAKKRLYALYKK